MIRLLNTVLFINSLLVLGFSVIPYIAMAKSKRKYLHILLGLFFAVLGTLGIYGAVTLKSLIYQ